MKKIGVVIVVSILIFGLFSGCLSQDQVVNIKDISVELEDDTYIATVKFDTTTTFTMVIEHPSAGEGRSSSQVPVHSSDSNSVRIPITVPQPGEFEARAKKDGEVISRYSEKISTVE